MAGTLLLPMPLATNAFVLGQLLSHPLDPSSGSYLSTSTTPVEDSQIHSKFKDLISHDDDGRFVASNSSRTLSSYDSLLLVQADEMSYSSVKQPKRAFDALREDPSAHPFLRSMASRNRPLYYVTGIQKLKNPTLRRAVAKEGSLTSVETTAEPKLRLPMHMRRDSAMDIDAASNEAVFAVELRKVKCHVGSSDEPHSIDDLGYTWSYHKIDQDELQLSIGLGAALTATELRTLAGITDHEDFTDGSVDGSDSDEEGLAGF